MHNARKRLINFRVTDEEFELLKTASAVQGSRCLSDFARSAILGHMGQAEAHSFPSDGGLISRLQSFDRRLAILESAMARISNALEDSNGNLMRAKA